jgi:hypothetical protein
MSFGEYVFLAGLFLKTGKGIKTSKRTKLNRDEIYSRRFQKTPEDTMVPPGLPRWPLPLSLQKLPPPPPRVASTPSFKLV